MTADIRLTTLYLDTGFRGARNSSESCLVVIPENEHEAAHGIMAAIADGVRGSQEAASRDALKALGSHYYAAPENWVLKHALQDSVTEANRFLVASSEPGQAVALSVLVFRRRRWAVAHAGHARVWLLRNNEIKLLTRDHVTPRVRGGPEVIKACGLEHKIDPDFISGEIAEGDIFVLTNQDAHSVLTGAHLLSYAMADASASQIATTIVDKALKLGKNISPCACVVRVEQVPQETREDLEEDIAALPAIAPPSVGDTVDGFQVDRLVHKSSRFRLYKAMDTQSGDVVALKFPNPRDAEKDSGFAERFLREEWIGRRVSSPHVVRTLALKKGRRTALYSVMAYPSGESLAKRLTRKGTLSLREVAFTGGQLLEALAQLHDQGVIHSDVRPQNILIERESREVMLLGLGSSHVAHANDTDSDLTSASRRATFLAPELFNPNTEPNVRSDIFAAGVTLYRMLTGSYPYGKLASASQKPRGRYTPATQHRPDIPSELDAILKRACALDSDERFESAQEFADALDVAIAQQATPEVAPVSTKPVRRRLSWEMAAVAGLIALLIFYLAFAV